MKSRRNTETATATARWLDDGGARRTVTVAGDGRPSRQDTLDASHLSDTRGEHRYDDVHQTSAEQRARQDRDDLKRRLAGSEGAR